MWKPIVNFCDFRLAVNVNLQSQKMSSKNSFVTHVFYLLPLDFMNDLEYKRTINDKRLLFINSIQMDANFQFFIGSKYLDSINIWKVIRESFCEYYIK